MPAAMKRTLHATPQDAETAFYEAFEKADLEAMMEVWADEEDIVCVHPGGARHLGAAEVRESWRAVFASGQTLRFQIAQQRSLNGMTLAVHSVYEHCTVVGDARPHSPLLATNIYLRTTSGWRMVVHHASPMQAVPASEPRRVPKTLH